MSDEEKVEEALEELPPELRTHVEAVAGYAESLAKELGADSETVRMGALLHDIGRTESAGIRHAAAGAEKVERLDLGSGEKLAEIVRSHVGSGIDEGEAGALGLPDGDYLPSTLEEKIVAYADSRFIGDDLLSFEEALSRFEEELGGDHAAVGRFRELHRELRND